MDGKVTKVPRHEREVALIEFIRGFTFPPGSQGSFAMYVKYMFYDEANGAQCVASSPDYNDQIRMCII